MPSVDDLKPRFQALLKPLVQSLAETGVTANHVTLAGVLLSFLVVAFIAYRAQPKWPLLLMPVALFLRMALKPGTRRRSDADRISRRQPRRVMENAQFKIPAYLRSLARVTIAVEVDPSFSDATEKIV